MKVDAGLAGLVRPIGPELEKLEIVAVAPPDLDHPQRGEDRQAVERAARDVHLDHQVGNRVNAQVKLALSPDAIGLVVEPVASIGLGPFGQILAPVRRRASPLDGNL